jgi:hypothetical protein
LGKDSGNSFAIHAANQGVSIMRHFVALIVLGWAQHAIAEEQAFRPLFDGKSLAGWVSKTEDGRESSESKWSVKDGVLIAEPGSGWLSTREKYGDYVLRLEWRVPENGNSGVFIRVPDLKAGQHPHVEGIEVQVLDDNGPEYKGKLQPYQYAGSIYGAVPAKDSAYRGAGEWNSFQITCQGPKIEVTMNGNVVATADVSQTDALKSRPRSGYIGLQNHGSKVEFRKIEIQVLAE